MNTDQNKTILQRCGFFDPTQVRVSISKFLDAKKPYRNQGEVLWEECGHTTHHNQAANRTPIRCTICHPITASHKR